MSQPSQQFFRALNRQAQHDLGFLLDDLFRHPVEEQLQILGLPDDAVVLARVEEDGARSQPIEKGPAIVSDEQDIRAECHKSSFRGREHGTGYSSFADGDGAEARYTAHCVRFR